MKLFSRILCASALLTLLAGCKTAPTQPQLDQAQAIARVTVQTAATAGLIARPEIRPLLQVSLKAVTAAVDNGKVTTTQLGALVNDLPVKSDTLRIVNGACLLWDAASVFWIDPATDAAILAIAKGVQEGLAAALGNTASKARAQYQMDALPSTIRNPPPTPAKTNTHRL